MWILLPFTVFIPHDEPFSEYSYELNELRIRIYPPYQALVSQQDLELDSPLSMQQVNQNLRPVEPQSETSAIRIDGAPTIKANALQIDFIRNGGYDRTSRSDDPPTDLCFSVLNHYLNRLRVLSRAGQIRPVTPTTTQWRITYLKDDGSEFEPDPTLAKIRSRAGSHWRLQFLTLKNQLWDAIQHLPTDYEIPVWDTLLLDGLSMLPDVGPAIVLAYVALETRIESALEVLAATQGATTIHLWEFINNRGDYRKEPSVVEQLDVLLRTLTGSSLKDEQNLWQAFTELRRARNAFVHKGQAVISEQNPQPVTEGKASELIASTQAIIDWIEGLLPESERRPRYEQQIEITGEKRMTD